MPSCPICAAPLKGSEEICPTCGAALNPTQHLPQGTQLQNGRYTVGKVLGQGGFGITYLGADTSRNQAVAIKELFPEGSSRRSSRVIPPTSLVGGFKETLQRFEDEARMLAGFNHPSIVKVFDVFEENATAYLVMEFLRGQTLGKRIEKEGKLSPALVQSIAIALTDALEVVHKAGLLHRDIKPDNVFLTDDGRVVLIDFGSARQFALGQTVSHTRLVTPGYAPLEQYGTAGKFGPYTDIYALGATLYHALMGVVPPAATDRIQNNAPLKLPSAMPDGLEKAVNQALEIRVDRRPQSVAEFRSILNLGKTPAAKVGSLSIQVTPPNAQLHLEGPNGFVLDLQGSQDLNSLAVGAYTLEGRANGFENQTLQIQLRPNDRSQVKLKLKPLPTPNPPSVTPAFADGYLAGAAIVLMYLSVAQPGNLGTFLEPFNALFSDQYRAILPDNPALSMGFRAVVYSGVFLAFSTLSAFFNSKSSWLLPAIVLSALLWGVYSNVFYLWEAGILAMCLLGWLIFLRLLRRYALLLAVFLGLLSALVWADPSKGEVLSPSGLAVAVLVVCLGGIVRQMRGRLP